VFVRLLETGGRLDASHPLEPPVHHGHEHRLNRIRDRAGTRHLRRRQIERSRRKTPAGKSDARLVLDRFRGNLHRAHDGVLHYSTA